jgi:glycopeptide antibiotics resistance protein
VENVRRENKVTAVLFIIYCLILTWVILFKMQFSFAGLDHRRAVNLIPFAGSVIVNGKIYFGEIVDNFIAFVPVGVYIGMLKPEWPFLRKVYPVLGISLSYEVLQFIFAVGASDITDLISNTLGGAAGIGFLYLMKKILKEKTGKILNAMAMVCTVLLVGLIGLLLY